MTESTRTCWCSTPALAPFDPYYQRCTSCETLVLMKNTTAAAGRVVNDETDYYGRHYWFAHQERDYGHSNLVTRARQDLPERCLHWLRALLQYRLPPGRSLELGCAHGGFVALLHLAGFQASGLELSPWVVEFARRTFDVSVYGGPIEDQPIEPRSLDVIAAMDVLEHLTNPVAILDRCASLLVDDGLLLFQTPRYVEGTSEQELRRTDDPFLAQLKSDEHIYLFSQTSLHRLLGERGFRHVAFLPAIFAHYDMFVVASREPLVERTQEERNAELSASPGGRIVCALLDKDDELSTVRQDLHQRLAASEADRAARLEVIEEQGRELARLQAQTHKWLTELQHRLDASETARVVEAKKWSRFARSRRVRLLRQLGLLPGKPRR